MEVNYFQKNFQVRPTPPPLNQLKSISVDSLRLSDYTADMENTNIKLHEYQLVILKNLALQKSARFNNLLIEGLGSEHMNYHLQKLVDFNLVTKAGAQYLLTDVGKDYTNLLDDNIEIVEKQPKTSVLLVVVRKNPKTNQVEHLLSKRLRHPYFGKVGRLTGKVRFGETLAQAAARELYEETGLKAKTIVLENLYHKLRYNDQKDVIQDVLFYTFFITDTHGELIERTQHQENFWISKNALLNRTDMDLFDGLKEALSDRLKPQKLSFTESVAQAEGF